MPCCGSHWVRTKYLSVNYLYTVEPDWSVVSDWHYLRVLENWAFSESVAFYFPFHVHRCWYLETFLLAELLSSLLPTLINLFLSITNNLIVSLKLLSIMEFLMLHMHGVIYYYYYYIIVVVNNLKCINYHLSTF